MTHGADVLGSGKCVFPSLFTSNNCTVLCHLRHEHRESGSGNVCTRTRLLLVCGVIFFPSDCDVIVGSRRSSFCFSPRLLSLFFSASVSLPLILSPFVLPLSLTLWFCLLASPSLCVSFHFFFSVLFGIVSFFVVQTCVGALCFAWMFVPCSVLIFVYCAFI